MKSGLTGRVVLLPGDDAEAYRKLVQRFLDRHKPVGDDELTLVHSLADTEWRLLRIPSLEMGIYALGRLEFAEKFSAVQDGAVRNALIETETFLTYQRQINNLGIQERRLRSQREKDLVELKQMQQDRQQKTKAQLTNAATLYEEAQKEGKPFNPAEFGFVFSNEQIQEHIACRDASRNGLYPDLAVLKFRKLRKAA